jgi:hypothetical protein
MDETWRSRPIGTVPVMQRFVARVWLPDRPGALGAVASRIGAVRGDVAGIDILERGGGRAVDELVVELPDGVPLELLISEMGQVDGVDVEDVRPAAENGHDPRLDALETAAMLVAAVAPVELLDALCQHGARTVGAAWAAVVDVDDGFVLASVGPAPPGPWLVAFVAGCQGAPVPDALWAPLPGADLALVMGRQDLPFRARERHQAAALARIVDTRFRELTARTSRLAHPSTGG